MIQMLEALAFLHGEDLIIVHRDITPENILYNQIDHFILAGFSLARKMPVKKDEYIERGLINTWRQRCMTVW
jgi:serine/threonine protein kinase